LTIALTVAEACHLADFSLLKRGPLTEVESVNHWIIEGIHNGCLLRTNGGYAVLKRMCQSDIYLSF
jgi:hypothetical protein